MPVRYICFARRMRGSGRESKGSNWNEAIKKFWPRSKVPNRKSDENSPVRTREKAVQGKKAVMRPIDRKFVETNEGKHHTLQLPTHWDSFHSPMKYWQLSYLPTGIILY